MKISDERLAKLIGMVCPDGGHVLPWEVVDYLRELQSLRAEVTKLRADAESVSAEREACAKLCEMVGGKKEGHSLGYRSAAWECAALIRGRGANNA